MKLLKEYYQLKLDANDGIIKEAIDKNEDFIISGIIQAADTLNANGRIYPRSILEREVNNYKKLVAEKRAWGEIDHPDRSIVEYKSVCCRVTKIWWEGNNVMGEVKIIPTACGRDLIEIFKDSGVVGISSRGLGSTKSKNNVEEVQDDFSIICWDLVAEPSTPGAVLTMESKEVSENQINEMTSKHFNKSDRIYRICNRILNRCDTHSCEL